MGEIWHRSRHQQSYSLNNCTYYGFAMCVSIASDHVAQDVYLTLKIMIRVLYIIDLTIYDYLILTNNRVISFTCHLADQQLTVNIHVRGKSRHYHQ